MNKARVATVFAPYLLVSIVYLVAQAGDNGPLAGFLKPLLMPTLLAAFLYSLPRIRSELALLGTLGILFSWAGDVTLGAPGDLSFLVGLGFFLLAHVAYIVLFLRRLRMRRLRWAALVYLAWWVALVAILAPHLGALLIPVAVYGLVLGSMGAIGLSCNRWIAIGGALFVVSDTLLGLNRFLPGFELWQIDTIIMVTYLAAQGFIAYGAIRMAWMLAARTAPTLERVPA
ncbi:putative membrane protein YhhN [Cryobacterium mesophilum]|uniref:Lysoplasmalogenase n=1 Tax=Terrimesophilobacter mesophilus TaxID=433647 RepID=A0A4R8V974_9MICO|nr:lysoplasmalogenase [Terrimesophilobacter mesophilus]MBB5632193.1 putative membrane protein YhhN [Terrimesophilobacter mesophilus]TFB79055.1 lysoplasmalogenase [Terrimesophilobacter mesophilus]